MGDSNRNKHFAKFIANHYPISKYPSVLVVADGLGELTAEIIKYGYDAVAVEGNMRDKRKRAKVPFMRKWFTRNTTFSQSLIVGMHPDEATAEIVLAAKLNNKPFAIVPCCILGEEAKGVTGFNGWIKKLKHISGADCYEYQLPIHGKRLVIYKD
jgi:hypothetical protein